MITFSDNPSTPPCARHAYRYDNTAPKAWIPTDSPSSHDLSTRELRLITWNLNAGGPNPEDRFIRILDHIRTKVLVATDTDPVPPCCILFQELNEVVFPVLLGNEWVQDNFLVTPISPDGWMTPYGLVTLVSKDIPLTTVFTIELPMTKVGRQALFIDMHLSVSPLIPSDLDPSDTRTIRVANTHLEPEASNGWRARPKQLKQIARMLNADNIDGFICAGSMCSVQDSDNTAPAEAGFADAWTPQASQKRRKVRSETWGCCANMTYFPPARLDKILYFPAEGITVGVPNRAGTKFTAFEGIYPSDHFGVTANVKVFQTP
ncbi:Endonuclease/exonuclease/phosphatase [Hysterangium stoloniferum]|nr:Endonuclease/exonuclease/phosphatase [Hysterangium stoloniferum]